MQILRHMHRAKLKTKKNYNKLVKINVKMNMYKYIHMYDNIIKRNIIHQYYVYTYLYVYPVIHIIIIIIIL